MVYTSDDDKASQNLYQLYHRRWRLDIISHMVLGAIPGVALGYPLAHELGWAGMFGSLLIASLGTLGGGYLRPFKRFFRTDKLENEYFEKLDKEIRRKTRDHYLR